MDKAATTRQHPIFTIAKANFHTWARSPRTLLMAFFVLTICFMQAKGFEKTLEYLPYGMNWGESWYYVLHTGMSFSITGILFLVMVCELPQRTSFQHTALIRSSRHQWMTAQILYCAWMALAMVALMAVFAGLFMLPVTSQGNGWTETKAVIDGLTSEEATLVSAFIRNHFTPFTAAMLACLPMVLFFFTMTLVILLCSICGVAVLGELLYVFLLMANVIIYVEFIPWIRTPIQYAILRAVLGRQDEWARLFQMAMVYLVLDSALIAALLLRARKTDLHF